MNIYKINRIGTYIYDDSFRIINDDLFAHALNGGTRESSPPPPPPWATISHTLF